MAFKKSLTQRLFNISRIPTPSLTNCRVSSSSMAVKAAAPDKIDHDPGDDAVFRRCFHRISASAASPDLRFFPTGERLLDKIRGIDIVKERIRIGEVSPPEEMVTVVDAKKLLFVSQIEIVKSRLREIEKVMKAIQDLIPSPAAHNPSNPRMKELQEMEKRKSTIDEKAEQLVRRELFCGLACLFIQTAALMRLTFWELTWDVMEPICFYGTSIYFIGRYGFFLRTSREPSFQGFFQNRFFTKQRQLMKLQNFNVERYNDLKKACYPDPMAPQEHLRT